MTSPPSLGKIVTQKGFAPGRVLKDQEDNLQVGIDFTTVSSSAPYFQNQVDSLTAPKCNILFLQKILKTVLILLCT